MVLQSVILILRELSIHPVWGLEDEEISQLGPYLIPYSSRNEAMPSYKSGLL